MKTINILALAFSVAVTLQAGPLKQAEFTRVVNDVKTLPEQQQPKSAKIGDIIAGRTAVTTGAQSRAELRFPDNTLTRLGSNSVFNMEQGTRNVDLKQGVMLMQVPKQMGGAKIRTAAVTAAVTGTTIMIEYQPDGYVKMIVLEGEMDVYLNDQPSTFKTIKAGDMIIMKPNSNYIPEPVQVDLERLKKTSRLTNDEEFGDLGNKNELNQADQQQSELKKDGQLIETALVIPGRGTEVVLDIDRVRDLVPGGVRLARGGTTPPPPPGVSPPGTSSGKFGKPGTLGGLAVISAATEIVTDPTINTRFSGTFATGQGKIYRPSVDGGLGGYVFNETTNRTDSADVGSVPNMDRGFRKLGSWGTFKFDDLVIVDQPGVNTTGGPTNLLLASASNISLSDMDSTDPYNFTHNGFWDMEQGRLNSLALVAYNNIYWDPSFTLAGTDQTVLLYTQQGSRGSQGESSISEGPAVSGDIIINAGFSPAVYLESGVFIASAARDLTVSSEYEQSEIATPGETQVVPQNSSTAIAAADVKLSAKRNLNVASGTTIQATNTLHVRAGNTLTIGDSSQLRRLANADPLDIVLAAEMGDVEVNGLSGGSVVINGNKVGIESAGGNVNLNYASISADVLRARTLSSSGQLLIGNSTLTATSGMKLYAEGASGGVRFTANSTLNGPAIIAGKTVQVDTGVAVTITTPNSLHIHADNHNYNGGSHGNFTNGSTNLNFLNDVDVGTGPRKHNFSSRPRY